MVNMSSDSKTIKPKTDFELILNYSNQCIWKKLNNDSGAGANADCRLDRTFSATDPLSEIVWSPDKGFSLKCVDSNFTNKRTSLFEDVEPSSLVLPLLQSVTDGSSTTKKPKDDVFVEPIAAICHKTSSTDTPARHPASDSVVIIPDHKTCEDGHDTGFGDNMEKIDTARETPNLPNSQKENVMNDLEKKICTQANIGTAIISEIKGNKSTISGQFDDERPVSNLLLLADETKCSMDENPSPRKHCTGGIETGVVNQLVEIEDGLYSRVGHIIEYKGSGALGTNLISSVISPSQKLKSTAENDLQTFNCEAAKGAVLVSESNENKSNSHVNEMMLLCNKNLPFMPSPSNSRIHMTRNGAKERSLSDGDSNASLSKDDDFHLSVESCHSTGLFLAGKKRCNFQQVIIGSKKVKRQIQEPCSKSNVQLDSSFMNLISNMIKGCSQSTQDEDKSLDLNLENHNHHLQWPHQKLLACSKSQDPELKNAGFRYNFQSIVGAKFKNVGTTMSQVGEASKDCELGKKVHGDATPITFYAENNSCYGQYFQSNKLEVSEGRLDACPSIQPHTRLDACPSNSHEYWKNDSLGLTKEKEAMALLSFHSSSTRQNRDNNENVESYALYERKEIGHRSDNVEGLWINRFLPKATSPLIAFDHLNERGGSEVHSTSCTMFPHSNEHISLNNYKIEEATEQSADDQLLSEAQNLHNSCINKDDSTVLKQDKRNQYHAAKPHKFFNKFTPFPGLRDSGPMVSMFARRLGAIKQFQNTE
ncbi:hypothetical protein VNO78_20109 [Psophocarpus tetragonolobus]|uniref:Uncharacterized protein n=1 Tax=Psophocarpus tetragonolobus TaxID=3891 RepID=A0AAN9XGV5_PSOTE